jgi:hypothetical protein
MATFSWECARRSHQRHLSVFPKLRAALMVNAGAAGNDESSAISRRIASRNVNRETSKGLAYPPLHPQPPTLSRPSPTTPGVFSRCPLAAPGLASGPRARNE